MSRAVFVYLVLSCTQHLGVSLVYSAHAHVLKNNGGSHTVQ